jgi:hypothetical protein
VLSRQVKFDDALRYELNQFPALDGRVRVRTATPRVIGAPVGIDDLAELAIPERTRTIIHFGAVPGEARGGGRSAWLFSAILSMIAHTVSDEMILGIVTDPCWQISESVLEKPDPEAYARRQIARAHDAHRQGAALDFSNVPIEDIDFGIAPTPLDFEDSDE